MEEGDKREDYDNISDEIRRLVEGVAKHGPDFFAVSSSGKITFHDCKTEKHTYDPETEQVAYELIDIQTFCERVNDAKACGRLDILREMLLYIIEHNLGYLRVECEFMRDYAQDAINEIEAEINIQIDEN